MKQEEVGVCEKVASSPPVGETLRVRSLSSTSREPLGGGDNVKSPPDELDDTLANNGKLPL